MSGIEVAGLVLGALPIVLSALKKYKGSCQPLMDWINFRETLGNLARPITFEIRLFNQNLQLLLLRVVENQDIRQAMCDDPRHLGWKEPQLDARLRDSLGGNYDCVIDQISGMDEQLQRSRKVLDVEQGNTQWLTDPNPDGKRRYQRLKVCMNKARTEKFAAAFAKDNAALKELLRTQRDMDVANSGSLVGRLLENGRLAARNLYSAFMRGWLGDCSSTHSASLRLERRPAGSTNQRWSTRQKPDFVVLLGHWSNSDPSQSRTWTETVIVPRAKQDDFSPTSTPLGHCRPDFLQRLQDDAAIKAPRVRFAPQTESSFVTTTQTSDDASMSAAQVVTDLCHALHTFTQSSCIGYLTHDNSDKYFLTQWKQDAVSDEKLISLADLLERPLDPAHSRSNFPLRLQLSVLVTSGVLQLWSTGWLRPQNMKKYMKIRDAYSPSVQLFVQIPLSEA